jgi:hypothetical protein
MKHWADEFQPRSLCSFDGGPDGGPGDSSAGPPGDTSGDFFGSNDGSFYGTNDSGSFVSSDPGSFQGTSTGGDSWTGSETGGTQFAASDPGSFFGDTSPGSDTGGSSFYSGSDGAYIGPNSDFGYAPSDGWGPTGGVDYTGGSAFYGTGGAPAQSGWGLQPGESGAIGPPGWATSEFGMYGNPNAGPSIGGPQAYGTPGNNSGINGPPGSQFGEPGAQFGQPGLPGWTGGPATVQPGEAGPYGLAPGGVQPTVNPDDRTEADPMSVFGPAFATNQAAPTSGWFGPSQAQAGQNMTNQGVIDAAMMANDFGRTNADLAQYIANTNPDLAQALSQAAAAYQGEWGQANTGQLGPGLAPFGDTTPGAQQGFQGVSNAQNSPNAFTSFAGPTTDARPDADTRQAGYDMLAQQMNEQQSNQNAQQSTQMMDAQSLGEQGRGPQTNDADARTAGYQQLADQMNAQNARQAGYDQLAQQMQAQNEQQAMIAGQEKGEQGKAGIFGVPSVDPATSKSGYDMLAQQMNAQQQQATPQQIQQGYQTLADQMNQQNMMTAKEQGDQQGRGEPFTPWAAPSQQNETIGLARGPNGEITQDVISALNPFTRGVGGEAAPLGLWSMQNEPAGRPGGSPAGLPSVGPFGPPGGRPGDDTSGRPGLSITVGGNPQAGGRPGGPGYYQTGGAGIAPGAKGAEYGGAYGVNSPGRPGTGAFGGDFRQGGGGGAYFYDPATGQYYQAGARR